MYKVYYDSGYNEGWEFEKFDNFPEALQFAEKQNDSEIVKYDTTITLKYNIKIIW